MLVYFHIIIVIAHQWLIRGRGATRAVDPTFAKAEYTFCSLSLLLSRDSTRPTNSGLIHRINTHLTKQKHIFFTPKHLIFMLTGCSHASVDVVLVTVSMDWKFCGWILHTVFPLDPLFGKARIHPCIYSIVRGNFFHSGVLHYFLCLISENGKI